MPRQPIVPEPANRPQGTVFVLVEECKGCGLCIELCPRGILEYSRGTNLKGHHYPIVTKTGPCANCQVCTLICSDFAIFSLPVGQRGLASTAEVSASPARVAATRTTGGKGFE